MKSSPDNLGAVTVPPGPASLPPAWMVLLAITALSAATAVAMIPLVESAFRDQPAAAGATARTGLLIAAGAAPVLAAIRGSVLAGIAWAVLVLWGSSPPYRRSWATLLVGELILATQGAWMAVVFRLRGGAAVSAPGDLLVTTGLNLFFPDPTTPLGAVAQSVTPFHLAWILFLAWRLTSLAEGRWGAGMVAALACWAPAPIMGMLRASGG